MLRAGTAYGAAAKPGPSSCISCGSFDDVGVVTTSSMEPARDAPFYSSLCTDIGIQQIEGQPSRASNIVGSTHKFFRRPKKTKKRAKPCDHSGLCSFGGAMQPVTRRQFAATETLLA